MTKNKQYMLAGCCDSKLRVINALSWKEVFAFDHLGNNDELNEMNTSSDINIYV